MVMDPQIKEEFIEICQREITKSRFGNPFMDFISVLNDFSKSHNEFLKNMAINTLADLEKSALGFGNGKIKTKTKGTSHDDILNSLKAGHVSSEAISIHLYGDGFHKKEIQPKLSYLSKMKKAVCLSRDNWKAL